MLLGGANLLKCQAIILGVPVLSTQNFLDRAVSKGYSSPTRDYQMDYYLSMSICDKSMAIQ